ncbi:CDP-alcohol phosphatidyltransferase family protein [Microcella alkaliphila]|uniref:CDP-alcohol phosphatidyltransferase family protein n=1 Tax=Microcella alkaliphila TaxID=279828 RepID=UPI00130092A1|nr:CDP-alcohol phosphatidyltransferase family protein [Microcella alkaliphila]
MTTANLAPADAARGAAQVGVGVRALGMFLGGATLISLGAATTTAALSGFATAPTVATAVSAVAGFGFAAAFLTRHHPHARLGAASAVTSIRWGLVSILVGLLVAGAPSAAAVIGLAIFALSLDGVDGKLARRQRLESRFGAAYDMEVDSVFALALAALAALGPAGPVALVLGLPRYLFGGAALIAPWLNGPLADRYSRKVICVVQLIALIALQLPWLPVWAALSIVIGVAAALVWSFAVDIVALRRARTA